MEKVCFGECDCQRPTIFGLWEEVGELHVRVNSPGVQCNFGKRPLNLLPWNKKSTSAADLFSWNGVQCVSAPWKMMFYVVYSLWNGHFGKHEPTVSWQRVETSFYKAIKQWWRLILMQQQSSEGWTPACRSERKWFHSQSLGLVRAFTCANHVFHWLWAIGAFDNVSVS